MNTERTMDLRREWCRAQRKLLVGHKHQVDPKPHPDVLRQRYAEIPEDTRSVTAIICGDPLPGRRAIDQRQPA